jgi:hypothetical protein
MNNESGKIVLLESEFDCTGDALLQAVNNTKEEHTITSKFFITEICSKIKQNNYETFYLQYF